MNIALSKTQRNELIQGLSAHAKGLLSIELLNNGHYQVTLADGRTSPIRNTEDLLSLFDAVPGLLDSLDENMTAFSAVAELKDHRDQVQALTQAMAGMRSESLGEVLDDLSHMLWVTRAKEALLSVGMEFSTQEPMEDVLFVALAQALPSFAFVKKEGETKVVANGEQMPNDLLSVLNTMGVKIYRPDRHPRLKAKLDPSKLVQQSSGTFALDNVSPLLAQAQKIVNTNVNKQDFIKGFHRACYKRNLALHLPEEGVDSLGYPPIGFSVATRKALIDVYQALQNDQLTQAESALSAIQCYYRPLCHVSGFKEQNSLANTLNQQRGMYAQALHDRLTASRTVLTPYIPTVKQLFEDYATPTFTDAEGTISALRRSSWAVTQISRISMGSASAEQVPQAIERLANVLQSGREREKTRRTSIQEGQHRQTLLEATRLDTLKADLYKKLTYAATLSGDEPSLSILGQWQGEGYAKSLLRSIKDNKTPAKITDEETVITAAATTIAEAINVTLYQPLVSMRDLLSESEHHLDNNHPEMAKVQENLLMVQQDLHDANQQQPLQTMETLIAAIDRMDNIDIEAIQLIATPPPLVLKDPVQTQATTPNVNDGESDEDIPATKAELEDAGQGSFLMDLEPSPKIEPEAKAKKEEIPTVEPVSDPLAAALELADRAEAFADTLKQNRDGKPGAIEGEFSDVSIEIAPLPIEGQQDAPQTLDDNRQNIATEQPNGTSEKETQENETNQPTPQDIRVSLDALFDTLSEKMFKDFDLVLPDEHDWFAQQWKSMIGGHTDLSQLPDEEMPVLEEKITQHFAPLIAAKNRRKITIWYEQSAEHDVASKRLIEAVRGISSLVVAENTPEHATLWVERSLAMSTRGICNLQGEIAPLVTSETLNEIATDVSSKFQELKTLTHETVVAWVNESIKLHQQRDELHQRMMALGEGDENYTLILTHQWETMFGQPNDFKGNVALAAKVVKCDDYLSDPEALECSKTLNADSFERVLSELDYITTEQLLDPEREPVLTVKSPELPGVPSDQKSEVEEEAVRRQRA